VADEQGGRSGGHSGLSRTAARPAADTIFSSRSRTNIKNKGGTSVLGWMPVQDAEPSVVSVRLCGDDG
jgi:hypothetical protein